MKPDLATSRFCPHCSSDLRGDPISEEHRAAYGGRSHLCRVIGIEYSGGTYDGVSEWMCPDCGYRQGRWSGRTLADDEFEPPFGGGSGPRQKDEIRSARFRPTAPVGSNG